MYFGCPQSLLFSSHLSIALFFCSSVSWGNRRAVSGRKWCHPYYTFTGNSHKQCHMLLLYWATLYCEVHPAVLVWMIWCCFRQVSTFFFISVDELCSLFLIGINTCLSTSWVVIRVHVCHCFLPKDFCTGAIAFPAFWIVSGVCALKFRSTLLSLRLRCSMNIRLWISSGAFVALKGSEGGD